MKSISVFRFSGSGSLRIKKTKEEDSNVINNDLLCRSFSKLYITNKGLNDMY